MNKLKLILINDIPDKTWTSIYQDTINTISNIDNNSEITRYIRILNENKISYVSHFSESMIGGKHPKYSNVFTIFIKTEDLEHMQQLLSEKGLFINKTIEEFKDVNSNEELTYKDLSSFNRRIHFFTLLIGPLLGLAGTILLACLSIQLDSGKTFPIILTIIFGYFTLLSIKHLLFPKK